MSHLTRILPIAVALLTAVVVPAYAQQAKHRPRKRKKSPDGGCRASSPAASH